VSDHPHEGHRGRLRERFRKNSLTGFAAHEALELLLSYCIPKRDVNPLAHELISHFGSFSGVLDAAPEELEQVPGIGEYSATFLNLVAQAAGYYQRDKYRSLTTLMTVADMGGYCMSLFLNDTSEKMYLVALNIHGQLLGNHMVCAGSLDELIVYPRQVVNAALRSNAYAVVLTHNHPGGSLRPSRADVLATSDIRRALATIDVSLLDHIIVGGGRYLSMTAHGYLDDEREGDEIFSLYMSCLDESDPDDLPKGKSSAARAKSKQRSNGSSGKAGGDAGGESDSAETGVEAEAKRKAEQKKSAKKADLTDEVGHEVASAKPKRETAHKKAVAPDEPEQEATSCDN
jgi:DNA repair protein RadC